MNEIVQAYLEWMFNKHKDEICEAAIKIYFEGGSSEEEARKIIERHYA